LREDQSCSRRKTLRQFTQGSGKVRTATEEVWRWTAKKVLSISESGKMMKRMATAAYV
jgi:hypothetical protein